MNGVEVGTVLGWELCAVFVVVKEDSLGVDVVGLYHWPMR